MTLFFTGPFKQIKGGKKNFAEFFYQKWKNPVPGPRCLKSHFLWKSGNFVLLCAFNWRVWLTLKAYKTRTAWKHYLFTLKQNPLFRVLILKYPEAFGMEGSLGIPELIITLYVSVKWAFRSTCVLRVYDFHVLTLWVQVPFNLNFARSNIHYEVCAQSLFVISKHFYDRRKPFRWNKINTQMENWNAYI